VIATADKSRFTKALTFLGALIGVLVLSGCGTSMRVYPDKAGIRAGKGAAVIAVIPQEKIEKEYWHTNVLGAIGVVTGGVLGGVFGGFLDREINREHQMQADRDLQPLYVLMRDNNFDQDFMVALKPKIESVAWLDAKEIKLSKDQSLSRFRRSEDSPLLYLFISYALSNDYAQLHLKVDAWEVKRKPRSKLKGPSATAEENLNRSDPPPLYRNVFLYTAILKDSDEISPAQRFDLWRSMNGVCLAERALNESIEDMVAALVDDLNLSSSEVNSQLHNSKYDDFVDGYIIDQAEQKKVPYIAGKIIKKFDNKKIVRLKDGTVGITVEVETKSGS
jgi:hypothetical protein